MNKSKNINQKEFESLPIAERFRLLENNGRYIKDRNYSSFNISLYYFNGFFTEIWRRVGLNQVAWIEVIKDEKLLERYYEDIELDNLR